MKLSELLGKSQTPAANPPPGKGGGLILTKAPAPAPCAAPAPEPSGGSETSRSSLPADRALGSQNHGEPLPMDWPPPGTPEAVWNEARMTEAGELGIYLTADNASAWLGIPGPGELGPILLLRLPLHGKVVTDSGGMAQAAPITNPPRSKL